MKTMKNHGIKSLTFLVLLAGLILSTGCVAAVAVGAGAGAGGYAWLKGELQRVYEVPMGQAAAASKNGLRALEFVNVQVQKDALEGRVTALMADGTKVRVRLKKLSSNTTKISVRVGAVGNRQRSELIHEKISQHF